MPALHDVRTPPHCTFSEKGPAHSCNTYSCLGADMRCHNETRSVLWERGVLLSSPGLQAPNHVYAIADALPSEQVHHQL